VRLLERLPATLLVVLAVVSVQFGNATGRAFFDSTSPTGAATLRLGFAALILLAVVRPRVHGWDRRTWLGVAGLGLALGGMNVAIYLSIDRIPIGVAVTLEFLGPLLVALVQVRRVLDAVWALLAFGGVVLLGLEPTGGLDGLGILFALTAAVCWAGYIVLSSRVGRRAAGLDGLAVAMGVALAVSLPFGAADAAGAIAAEPVLLLVFAAVALATSVIPYSFEFTALRRLETRVFGVLSALGPAMAALAGFVVLGETLGPVQLLALALVTVATIGVQRTLRRRTDADSQREPSGGLNRIEG
jgi:inner membrane transporter RhtA